jgi:hypothetical protein
VRADLWIDSCKHAFARICLCRLLDERRHAAYTDAAAKANEAIERRADVDLPDNRSRVDFRISDLGKYRIVITLFCPTRLADALENDIT